MREIQTLATEKRAHTARGRRRAVGLLQDALLIPALKVRRLALVTTSGSGRDADAGVAPASVGAALRFAPTEPLEERTTPRELPFISFLFLLALRIN